MCKDGRSAWSFYKVHKCPCRINMNVALWAQHYYFMCGGSVWRQQHFVIQAFLCSAGGFSQAGWFVCAVGAALLWLVLPASEVLFKKKWCSDDKKPIGNTSSRIGLSKSTEMEGVYSNFSKPQVMQVWLLCRRITLICVFNIFPDFLDFLQLLRRATETLCFDLMSL